MPSYAGPNPSSRSGDVTGTLWLLAYLALAVVLIVLDHRGGWLSQARAQASLLVQPLWMVAGWPGRMAQTLYDDAGTLSQLTAENARLRNELLVNSARITRLQTLAADNEHLRGLLGAARSGGLDVQLAPILDIDLDPARQRLVLDAGSNHGVRAGQTVIDAGGVVGQIIAVQPIHSTVLLLTDPSHAVPVSVARSEVRLVAYGDGRSDMLRLPGIALSSDVQVGDTLLTSGLGGRFPPGFPVGTILSLQPDESRAFLVGEVRPAAQLDRGRDVLLLRSVPVPAGEGDPVDGGSGPADAAGGTGRVHPPETVGPATVTGRSRAEAAPDVPAPAPRTATEARQ